MSNASQIAKLARFSTNVGKLKSLPQRIANDVAFHLKTQVLETSAEEKDPYGRKWKARKVPKAWPILNKTGRLRRSYQVTVKRGLLAVRNTAPYARFHQAGTKFLPVRLVLPTRSQGLPTSWTKIIDRSFKQQFKKVMR